MSRKRSEAAIRAYEERFIEGGMAHGASREVAEQVWSQIVGFSGFGFPKAHSAAFGLLAYQSTWLRVHYRPEFLCALLNEQPMGFYPPDALVHEAQRRGHGGAPALRRPERGRLPGGGVPAAPSLAVRLGLGYVDGVREEEVRALVAEREPGGPLRSLGDLAARSGASGDTLARLAWAGACDSLVERPRRTGRRRAAARRTLDARASPFPGRPCRTGPQLALPLDPHDAPALSALTAWERMLADYGSTKVTLREHPLELMRPGLPARPAHEPRAREPSERAARAGRRPRGRAPAPGDREGRHVHAARGRARDDQPDRATPVHERCRLAVRAEPLVLARAGSSGARGTRTWWSTSIARLERPDLPVAEVRHIEPRRTWSSEAGEEVPARAAAAGGGAHAAEEADLRAVAPAGHAFGRRGR